MANTFNIDTKSSVSNSGTGSSATNVVTAGGTATLVVLSILISNKTATSAQVDVFVVKNSGDNVFLIKNAPIPGGSSLEIISGSKIILESSDVLRINSNTASALDAAVSYLEQT